MAEAIQYNVFSNASMANDEVLLSFSWKTRRASMIRIAMSFYFGEDSIHLE